MNALRFACQFSNGACGSICIDLRRFRENGLIQFAPHIMGPAPEDEVEDWMREEVLSEIVSRTGKEALVIGASGVQWRLRPGQSPERTGRCFPPWFSSILPELEAEFMRRNRNGGSAQ